MTGRTPTIDLDTLPLSSRARNALRRQGIRTTDGLLAYTAMDLLDLRGVGVDTVAGIEQALAAVGQRLAPGTLTSRVAHDARRQGVHLADMTWC